MLQNNVEAMVDGGCEHEVREDYKAAKSWAEVRTWSGVWIFLEVQWEVTYRI